LTLPHSFSLFLDFVNSVAMITIGGKNDETAADAVADLLWSYRHNAKGDCFCAGTLFVGRLEEHTVGYHSKEQCRHDLKNIQLAIMARNSVAMQAPRR
jgi:hypothetical protein